MMKIKLIIILFGISCLFFPAELMEAEGSAWQQLIKTGAKIGKEIGKKGGSAVAREARGAADDGAKLLKELAAELKEYTGLKKIGPQYDDNIGGEIAFSIKDSIRKSLVACGELDVDSQEPDKIRFNDWSDWHGYDISVPCFWDAYDVKDYLVTSSEIKNKDFREIILFTDNQVNATSIDTKWDVGSFLLFIKNQDRESDVELKEEFNKQVQMEYKEACDETPTTCSDFQIIGKVKATEQPLYIEIEYSQKIRADTDSQFVVVVQKVKTIANDNFIFQLHFANEKSKFAEYSKLYDYIANKFQLTEYEPKDGGCLIATAAFGSEMAPQVQFLREIRDNTVLQTESGTSFMMGFNQFYYSFSPAVADYERENPAFKEAVKLTLIPLLTSLTLLQYADIDSESEMLGYGIGVILLNIGMYFVAPAVLIMKIRKRI